jgi:hypothetical protein
MRLIHLVVLIALVGCAKLDKPAPSQVAQAQALSNHSVLAASYEIPEGVFRGVLWPSSEKQGFTIWIIQAGKETYFEIRAPSGFARYEKETTADWNINIVETTDSTKKYGVRRKDGSKSIQLELPLKKRDYSFSVLNNSSGDEILIFMDISETTVDQGLFGFVTITDKT